MVWCNTHREGRRAGCWPQFPDDHGHEHHSSWCLDWGFRVVPGPMTRARGGLFSIPDGDGADRCFSRAQRKEALSAKGSCNDSLGAPLCRLLSLPPSKGGRCVLLGTISSMGRGRVREKRVQRGREGGETGSAGQRTEDGETGTSRQARDQQHPRL